jgi:hypothetical protein
MEQTRDFTNIAKKILLSFQYTPVEYEKQIFNKFLDDFSNYENIHNIFSYLYEMFQWRYSSENEISGNELLVVDLLFVLNVKEKQYNLSDNDIVNFERILDSAICKIKKLYIKCIVKSITKYFISLIKSNKSAELKKRIIHFNTKYRNVLTYIIEEIEANKNITFENMEYLIFHKLNEERYTMYDVDILYNYIIERLSFKK